MALLVRLGDRFQHGRAIIERDENAVAWLQVRDALAGCNFPFRPVFQCHRSGLPVDARNCAISLASERGQHGSDDRCANQKAAYHGSHDSQVLAWQL